MARLWVDMSEPRLNGAVLLLVHEALFYSVVGVVGGPTMVVFSLFARGNGLWAGWRMLGLLFGLVVTVLGIRDLWNRPVLMELTERGIMVHAKAGVSISMSLLRDLFIPWERIQCIYYLSGDEVQARGLWLVSGGRGTANAVIVLRVRMDGVWPNNGTLRDDLATRRARPGEIYLNAFKCSPGETELWEQVQAIARLHGVSISDG